MQTARGLAATNLALPGFGSIMAGRAVGWPQSTLTVVGFVLTLIYSVRAVVWFYRNWNKVYGDDLDSLDATTALWRLLTWAFLGIGLFLVAWVWAFATNASILRSATHARFGEKPPVLKPGPD